MTSALTSLEPGTVFGRDFRLVRLLAEGGMGAVYVAEQLSSGNLRALKVLRPEVVHDERGREQFLLEARITSQIPSGHVVEVVAAGVEESSGIPWIAMELLEGEDLTDMVRRRGRIPPQEVLEIFTQLGDALAAAHATGVVHRDLKPRNIFVARSRFRGMPFVVKVLDFGISRVLVDVHAAQVTQQLGSPLFMAPEQGRAGATLHRSTDVWPLGLLAYLLLTGRHYWRSASPEGVDLQALLVEIAVDPIEPATARAQQQRVLSLLPAGFDGWFLRCVDRDPAARFADAGEAVAALREVLLGRHVQDPELDATVIRVAPPPDEHEEILAEQEVTTTPETPPPGAPPTGPATVPPLPVSTALSPSGAHTIPPVMVGPTTGPHTMPPGFAGPTTGPHTIPPVTGPAVHPLGFAEATGRPMTHEVAVPDDARPVPWRRAALATVGVAAAVMIGLWTFARPDPPTIASPPPPRHTPAWSADAASAPVVLAPPSVVVDAAVEPVAVVQQSLVADAAVVVALPSARPEPLVPRRRGALTVSAYPPRCTVKVDGRVWGPTPILNRPIPAGVHRVVCERPRAQAVARTVRVVPDREAEVIFPAP